MDVDSSSSGRKAKKRFPKKVSPATFPSANFREIFLSNLVFGQQHSSKSLLVKNEKQQKNTQKTQKKSGLGRGHRGGSQQPAAVQCFVHRHVVSWLEMPKTFIHLANRWWHRAKHVCDVPLITRSKGLIPPWRTIPKVVRKHHEL